MYQGLKSYENEKKSIIWPRESADMTTIMESLFTTRSDGSASESILYTLQKRIAVLIGFEFPDIEKDIKELYNERSKFVHGSLFVEIANKMKDKESLPLPDFRSLYKYKEYVRFALIAYLNLTSVIKKRNIADFQKTINALEKGVIDLEIRKKIALNTKKIFRLLPKEQFKGLKA